MKQERNAHRLDLVEENGRLVIGRAQKGAIIGRVVGSVLIGLLGLAALVLGADGFVGVCGFLLLIVFGIVLPIVVVKRHNQDHSLELTPEARSAARRVGKAYQVTRQA